MTNESNATTPPRMIDIELLALDLTTCGRCTGTDRNLTSAIESVAALFRETGTQVRVTKHVVTDAQQAEKLGLVASPTIRVNGRDIAMEFKESSCKDCSDLCGCNGGVDCRVWIWQGQEHLEAPRSMIVDALLKAYAAGPVVPESKPYTMPQNLRSFFAARSVASKATTAKPQATKDDACCDTTTCCEPSAKSACCGDGLVDSTKRANRKEPWGVLSPL